MQNQSELTCVSCENTFDPTPHGGFCPDCDTPHPDFGRPEAESDGGTTENAPAEADEAEIQQAVSEDEEEAADAEDDGDVADLDEVDDDAEVDDEVEPDDEVADVDDEADDVDEDAEVDDDDGLEEVESDDDLDDDAEADDDVEDADDNLDADAEGEECGSCGTAVEPSASFCPECGASLDEEEEEAPELSACPDCGSDVDDESFCPECGTDLDEARDRLGGEGAAETGVTLVIDGDSYSFADGDSFGRQEEDWLESLVRAAGGREEVKYISSDHLEFSVEDDGVYVSDVSTNGTLLNGEDLEGGEAKLEDGDELELAGRATIQIEL